MFVATLVTIVSSLKGHKYLQIGERALYAVSMKWDTMQHYQEKSTNTFNMNEPQKHYIK